MLGSLLLLKNLKELEEDSKRLVNLRRSFPLLPLLPYCYCSSLYLYRWMRMTIDVLL